jgi:uncharacterized protein
MKLSDGEKLILLMLSELYEKVGIKGEIDPDFIKSAIFSDMLWGINWKYSGIPFQETDDPPIVREVLDILDMWSFIESAYGKLTAEDKQKVEKEADPFGKDPKFNGFDGNNEPEYIGTAMFLVNDLERFSEFKGRDFNCHFPSIGMHKRMLSAFAPIRKDLWNRKLSADDLIILLKARSHPSNRNA